MNRYTVEFFAPCPSNGLRIKYTLTIETSSVIRVEDIIAATETDEGFHEELADGFFQRFAGRQTMTADHHGVRIETVRVNASSERGQPARKSYHREDI